MPNSETSSIPTTLGSTQFGTTIYGDNLGDPTANVNTPSYAAIVTGTPGTICLEVKGDLLVGGSIIGGSGVSAVVAGTGIDVDSTDPAEPIVGLDSATQDSLALADTAYQIPSVPEITGTTEQEQIDSIVEALVTLGLATDGR